MGNAWRCNNGFRGSIYKSMKLWNDGMASFIRQGRTWTPKQ